MKKKISFIIKDLQYVNPVKQTCDHLMGKDHTPAHRMGAGVVYIFTGVLISKIGEGYVHLFFDAFGYLIHAFGTIPMVEELQRYLSREKNPKNVDTTGKVGTLPEITEKIS